jgi:hypothetical protein
VVHASFFFEPEQLSFKDFKTNYNFAGREIILLQLLRLELKSHAYKQGPQEATRVHASARWLLNLAAWYARR